MNSAPGLARAIEERNEHRQSKALSWMSFFACRSCKRRHSEDGLEAGETCTVLCSRASTTLANGSVTNTGPVVDFGSLTRPLSCRSSKIKGKFSIRTDSQNSRGGGSGAGGDGETHAGSTPFAARRSNFLDTWRSLPNLRSPSLAVRAMSARFQAFTSSSGSDKVTKRRTKKKARFQETVEVVVHDENGEPISTQSVKINYGDEGDDAMDSARAPDKHLTMAAGCQTLVLESIDIVRNDNGHKSLRCVIHVGDGIDRERMTVRSATGGTKLVVITYRAEPLGDGTMYWSQVMDKFRLPHAINPHDVNAVLHSGGDLVIQAPLFDFDADINDT